MPGSIAKEAAKRFYLVDRDGLLVEGMNGLMPFQEPFLQDKAVAQDWQLEQPGRIDAARRGAQRQADHDDRRVRPARRVLEAGGDARWRSTSNAAGHLPAVESDLARRGDAATI